MNEILESLFQEFLRLIRSESGEEFKSFQSSKYLNEQENYKYQVFEEARDGLGSKWWKEGDIGTGLIQKGIVSAIKPTVRYNSKSQTNNLVYWRKKSEFAGRPKSKSLEATLYAFYKGKIKDGEAFEQLSSEGLDYQFIAYLFFIKDRNQYLPISQERFDGIFQLIGRPDFKTRNSISWSNYSEFCKIIKDVRVFLKTKDKEATLLDAHSFLWILGSRTIDQGINSGESDLQSEKIEHVPPDPTEVDRLDGDSSNRMATVLTQSKWAEILSNTDLTAESDLRVFQVLYFCNEKKATGSELGALLGYTGTAPQSPLNSWVGQYAKRICSQYPIQFTLRENGKPKYWDFFFNGKGEDSGFTWQLKPELAEALVSTGLTGEHIFPDELSSREHPRSPEGMKSVVLVNRYERSPEARLACKKYWGTNCIVCAFDFGRTYGDHGKDFIHVHHLTPISEVGMEYLVDPINDLRPVCPNCHAMLHRGPKTLSIEELKSLMWADREANNEL